MCYVLPWVGKVVGQCFFEVAIAVTIETMFFFHFLLRSGGANKRPT